MARSSKSTTQSPAALKRRIAELEKQLVAEKAKPTNARPSGGTMRKLKSFTSAFLVLLTAISLLASLTAFWVQKNVVNTDTWVAKTNEVIRDPFVRADISHNVSDAIFQRVDVQQYVTNALPERAQPLAGPISSSLKGFTTDQINKILQSPKFLTFWQNANRSAHNGIVTSLQKANDKSKPSATSDVVFINGDKLILNLQPVIANVTDQLKSSGVGFLSNINTGSINTQITLGTVQNLPAILAVFNTINKLRYILPVITLLLGAAALWLSRNRRRTLIAIAISSIVLLILDSQLVFLGQVPFVSAITQALKNSSSASAISIYQIYTKDLVFLNRIFIVLMALIILFTYLSGPGKNAAWLRLQLSKLFSGRADWAWLHWATKHVSTVIGSIATLVALLIIIPAVHGPWFPLILVVLTGIISFALLSARTAFETPAVKRGPRAR